VARDDFEAFIMIEEIINRQGQAINAMSEAIKIMQQEAQAKALAEQQDKLQKFLLEVHTKIFEKAQAYVNVITIAGYAGAFAIWSAIRPSLPLKANITVALSLGVSLVAFVLWEVFGMVVRASNFQKMRPLLLEQIAPEKFFEKLKKLQEAEARANVRLTRIWSVVLFFCLVTALFAIGILFYNFFAILVKLPLWPQ
jgi:hypothetical protein